MPNFWDPRARLERPAPETLVPIRFLATDDFPPFSFRDRRGALIGFNIDLADAICRVLKVSCAMQVRPFDTLREGLRDGTGNAILAGLDPEKSADEGLSATQAYLKIPGRFVAAPRRRLRSRRGMLAAASSGLPAAARTRRSSPASSRPCGPPATPRPAVALGELKDGRIAAVFGDAVGLAFWLHGPDSADCCRFAGGPYVDDRLFGAGLSIVVKREDRALKQALDYALREVQRAGTYEELYLRYFPVSLF